MKPGSKETSAITYTYGTAAKGMIMQSVTGTGQISSSRESSVTSKVASKVLKVTVANGQKVKTGDIIARLDSSDANSAVWDAQESLESAKLSLEKLQTVDDLTLIQAKNALTAAKESLESSKDDLNENYEQGFNAVASAMIDFPAAIEGMRNIVVGTSSYVVQSSPTYLDYYYDAIKSYDSQADELEAKAASSYQQAKTDYERNFQSYKSTSNLSSESEIETLIESTYQTSKSIAQALKDINTFVQRYQDVMNAQKITPQTFSTTHLSNLSGYIAQSNSNVSDLFSAGQNIENSKSAITSGQRAVDEKTKSLADVAAGADALDVKSSQLSIQQKERALADAQDNLDNYTIVAPFDGVVASVDVDEGDNVAANGSIAKIITSSQIATVTLNEVDIAKVEVGQKAMLTFTAIDGLTATGKVIEVSTIGTVSQGVVSYEVVVALDTESDQVKSGMSISAAIITQTKQDVVLVPSIAVKSGNNGSYVLMPVSGDSVEQVTEQAVTVGLSDDTNTEISDGLSEGDKIVVSSAKSTSAKSVTSSSKSSGNSIFNLGGGPVR